MVAAEAVAEFLEHHDAPAGALDPHSADQILLPLAFAVCALLPRLLLYPYLDERSAFVLFTLAVMASAWYGGWRLGLLATVISDGLGA